MSVRLVSPSTPTVPTAAPAGRGPRPRSPRSTLHTLQGAALTLLLACVSLAAPAKDGPGQTLQKIAGDLVSPMVVANLDAQRLLIADQVGLVYVLQPDGSRRPDPFFDLRPKLTKLNNGFDERGLLGLALHPGFATNRRLFVYYSAPRRETCPTNWDHTTHISEFTVTPDLARVDTASEKVLLAINQPYFNHNGGRIGFGPDGFLYIGVGDGGNANDEGHDRSPVGNAQDLTTLLGKFLRIDVDHPTPDRPYGIPTDNPLINRQGARPEIYAWGIRNPWGWSFDRGGQRELFSADVGQNRYEEVNIIRRGGNYGWNQREGLHPFNPKKPGSLSDDELMVPSDRSAFLDPIVEYKNVNLFAKDPGALGISVTGGCVYRGRALPHLEGRYVFADWSRQWAVPDGRLYFASRPKDAATKRWSVEPLPVVSHPDQKLGVYVLAFSQDAEGELYVLTTQRTGLTDRTGAVWKLVPAK